MKEKIKKKKVGEAFCGKEICKDCRIKMMKREYQEKMEEFKDKKLFNGTKTLRN